MALDPELRATMNQTIFIASLGGLSDFGDPQYDTPREAKARVEAETASSSRGDETLSDFLITTEEPISKNDRVWLPGEDVTDTAASRMPQKVFEVPDEDGSTSHFEVLI